MIYEEIKVEWYRENKSKKIVFDIDDMDYDVYDNDDYREFSRTYHVFKNNGHVSKTDKHENEIVNQEAERLLAERLRIKSETPKDMERAMYLREIISDAYNKMPDRNVNVHWDIMKESKEFTDAETPGWTTIKTKTSHSNWYENEGIGHARSIYHIQVPTSVIEEAKELYKIRKNIKGMTPLTSH